jgi:hypothetical protein
MRIIVLFFVLFAICGCDADYKFVSYSCKSAEEDCKGINPVVTSFKVDKAKSQILVTTYLRNKASSNIIWDESNCMIFDEKNWSCNAIINSQVFWSYRMVDGEMFHDPDSISLENKEKYITKKIHFWNAYMYE